MSATLTFNSNSSLRMSPCSNKVAILVGNENSFFETFPHLYAPIEDTQNLATVLHHIGFQVFALVNLTNAEMTSLVNFVAKNFIDDGTYVIFIYCGYMIPLGGDKPTDPQFVLIGVDTRSIDDLGNCLSDVDIFEKLTSKHPTLFLTILDVCIDRQSSISGEISLHHSSDGLFSTTACRNVGRFYSIHNHAAAKRWNSLGESSSPLAKLLRPILGDNASLSRVLQKLEDGLQEEISKVKYYGTLTATKDVRFDITDISLSDCVGDILANPVTIHRQLQCRLTEVPASLHIPDLRDNANIQLHFSILGYSLTNCLKLTIETRWDPDPTFNKFTTKIIGITDDQLRVLRVSGNPKRPDLVQYIFFGLQRISLPYLAFRLHMLSVSSQRVVDKRTVRIMTPSLTAFKLNYRQGTYSGAKVLPTTVDPDKIMMADRPHVSFEESASNYTFHALRAPTVYRKLRPQTPPV